MSRGLLTIQFDARLAQQKLVATAAAFIRAYPIGAVVRGDEILRWAHEHADVADLLAADLLIDGRSKMLGSLRRHLNMAGASLPEVAHFRVATVEGEREVFVVCALAERGVR
jgi:hypothetical protein